ncbi:unnamed protein product [Candida verbasci]|uniref:Phosphomethylpyrimidine kinase n=1 Tax=Candida verbasci TaxID=1227364 RepID=A0A9W4TU08_9ASCO|nr:unnamed protein product [Candida verbasci]
MTKVYQLKNVPSNEVDLPVVLTIAGSDSSGGAGIEADLKTFSAFGVYGMTCITALTAQNTKGVKTFEKTSSELIKQVLNANLDDFLYNYTGTAPLKVIKTGMLTKEAIKEFSYQLPKLKEHKVKIVIDPVMVSTSGSKLIDEEGMSLCVDHLIKDVFLITPNYPEAQELYNIKEGKEYEEVQSLEDFKNLAKSLQQSLQCKNILVKGGHIPFDANNNVATSNSSKIIDVLYQSELDDWVIFESEFIDSKDNHGSGCTLASAIAANLAKGKELDDSIILSIDFIHKGMSTLQRKLGFGNGPLNHFAKPAASISSVLNGSYNEVKKLLSQHDSFYHFLTTHPSVKDNWTKYVNHPFVKAIAENTLQFDKFLYFLKQDYHYLINYAQIHGLAASTAPNYKQTHAQATIIGEIVTEIEKHKEKLMKNYNIDYVKDYEIDSGLKPGKACQDYCDYLLRIGKKENFLGIKVAVAPCLHGYAEAGTYGQSIRKDTEVLGVVTEDQAKIYQTWLDDYTSDWYTNADKEGKNALESLINDNELNIKRVDELVDMFNQVVLLEIEFWNECLNL